MTAQIGILNANGAALASDSNLTVMRKGKEKFISNDEKIFPLGENHQVAIMTSGNARYLNIPWKTVIALFKEHLGDKKLHRLDDYIESFIEFLTVSSHTFVSDEKLIKYTKSSIKNYLLLVLDKISEEYQTQRDKDPEISIDKITNTILNSEDKWWQEAEFPNGFNDLTFQEILSYSSPIIDEVLNEFTSKKVTDNYQRFKEIINSYLTKFRKRVSAHSELVFAGFGSEEILPSIKSILITNPINKKIKFVNQVNASIQNNTQCAIYPFAQKNGLDGFVDGVEEDILDVVKECFNGIYDTLPQKVMQIIDFLNEQQKQDMQKIVAECIDHELKKVIKIVIDYKFENHTEPMLSVLESLPPVELAKVAASLVNIISLKSSVSMNLDASVGGSTDTAVITRSDGFKWISYSQLQTK